MVIGVSTPYDRFYACSRCGLIYESLQDAKNAKNGAPTKDHAA